MYWCHECSRYVPVERHRSLQCACCHGSVISEVEDDRASASQSPPTNGMSHPSNQYFLILVPQPAFLVRREAPTQSFSDLPPQPAPRIEYSQPASWQVSLYLQLQQLHHDHQVEHSAFQNDPSHYPRTTPACKNIISTLPIVKFNDDDDNKTPSSPTKSQPDCAVCQYQISQGLELPCRHVYHSECISEWFQKSNTCPLCRYELPTDDEDFEIGRRRRRQLLRDEQLLTLNSEKKDEEKVGDEKDKIEVGEIVSEQSKSINLKKRRGRRDTLNGGEEGPSQRPKRRCTRGVQMCRGDGID